MFFINSFNPNLIQPTYTHSSLGWAISPCPTISLERGDTMWLCDALLWMLLKDYDKSCYCYNYTAICTKTNISNQKIT